MTLKEFIEYIRVYGIPDTVELRISNDNLYLYEITSLVAHYRPEENEKGTTRIPGILVLCSPNVDVGKLMNNLNN